MSDTGRDGLLQPADVLSGCTFDGVPCKIVLERAPFKYGSSAKIRRGHMLNESIAVAVKVFGGMLDAVKQELLLHELRISREVALRHQSILTFLGTVNVDDQQAIVSLYMKNGNMMEYMQARPGCDKKRLILQIAEAVSYLHGPMHIVHGDIKCSNVMISDVGDALLSDFGLSTFAEKSQPVTTTMTAIQRMNTLQFAAPELLIDAGTAPPSKTCESDVYAFGMFILEPEALFEKLPWPDQSKFSLMNKVCLGKHPAWKITTHASKSISHSWWITCLRCWRFTPAERPPINQVLCALRATNHLGCREFYLEEAIIIVPLSPDCNTVAGVAVDGSVVLYDGATGLTSHLLHAGIDHVHSIFDLSIAVSPDGQRIASANDTTVKVWDASSGAHVASMEHGRWVTCIAFSPDGTSIASGRSDGTIQIWDAETGAACGDRLRGDTSSITCLSFTPDGRCFASGSYDGRIILWDSVTGTPTQTLRRPYELDRVFSVGFLLGGKQVISAYRYTVVIWNVGETVPFHTCDSELDSTWCVAISPSMPHAAWGSPGGDIYIWDVEHQKQIGAPLNGHGEILRSIAFSPDGRSLISASWGRKIRVWDLFDSVTTVSSDIHTVARATEGAWHGNTGHFVQATEPFL